MNPNAAMTQTDGADFTLWLVMFGILIIVALVLAYLSRGIEK